MTRELLNESKNPSAQAAVAAKPKSSRVRSNPAGLAWWQLALTSGVLAALVTASPQILIAAKAFVRDQTTDEYLYAVQQQKFWTENSVCVNEIYNPDDFLNDPGNVTAIQCPSKDIAVIYINGTSGLPVYAGIGIDFLRKKIPFKEVASNDILGMAAFAALPPELAGSQKIQSLDGPGETTIAQAAQVICQQMQDDGRTLLRHINNGAGACFDEFVDTFTGVVTNVQQVPCRQTCG